MKRYTRYFATIIRDPKCSNHSGRNVSQENSIEHLNKWRDFSLPLNASASRALTRDRVLSKEVPERLFWVVFKRTVIRTVDAGEKEEPFSAICVVKKALYGMTSWDLSGNVPRNGA